MRGYIDTLEKFVNTSTDEIVEFLLKEYPNADISQQNSWRQLIKDVKGIILKYIINKSILIAFEYMLPNDGMVLDLGFFGIDKQNQKVAYFIESKQWNDQYIRQLDFSKYREYDTTLHPQIQIGRQVISFRDYLDIGQQYLIKPFVYINNISDDGTSYLINNNPDRRYENISIVSSLTSVLDDIYMLNLVSDTKQLEEIYQAQFKPSKNIISAMESIITKQDPFILTDKQKKALQLIYEAFDSGKKIVRITGPAGSGKTAILLHLYINYLNKAKDGIQPLLITGAQNTALYQDMFKEVERSFTYSFSLDNMVAKTHGERYYIMMDEAQHNRKGIISNMIIRNCNLILSYDLGQTINADNSINELQIIEKRNDFISIELKELVRFNGSQKFDTNIKSLLQGNKDFEDDDLYDFRLFDNQKDFENQILNKIKSEPYNTFAVVGLLSNDADKYANHNNTRFITGWKYKEECRWIPYISEKNYLSKNDGKIWVGTWWMPGLDVDYVAIIIGGDAYLTDEGIKGNPEEAKHYLMMISVAIDMNFPQSLLVSKNSFGKQKQDNYRSAKNILDYINNPSRTQIREDFLERFSELIHNNYYIMMTRGCKGCYVFFTDDRTQQRRTNDK